MRITTHYHADMVASSLFSVIHEGGHALYELHTGRELARSNLGTGVSMGIHESQSRFYENIIGRSRAFCSIIYPWLKEHFAPRLDHVTEDDFYRMINKSEPSLIRTEADELTYCPVSYTHLDVYKRQPRPRPLSTGMPLPRSRNTAPVWVPSGMLYSTESSMVGIFSFAPSTAWLNVMGASQNTS